MLKPLQEGLVGSGLTPAVMDGGGWGFEDTGHPHISEGGGYVLNGVMGLLDCGRVHLEESIIDTKWGR